MFFNMRFIKFFNLIILFHIKQKNNKEKSLRFACNNFKA